jgi:uncharacterized protein YndB with AHSA1/START domain
MSNAAMSETTLRLERMIPAPPEVLFALWTDPRELVKWWAPDGFKAVVDTLDASPGGRWRIVLHRFDGGLLALSGAFRIVEPPRRLAFTWAWENESGARGHETEVTVTFAATHGGSRLTLLQQRFDSKRARDGHQAGWSAGFDRLAKIAA